MGLFSRRDDDYDEDEYEDEEEYDEEDDAEEDDAEEEPSEPVETVSLYVKIRQFLQPYYRKRPKGARRQGEKIKNDEAKKKATADTTSEPKSVNGDPDLKCRLKFIPQPLDHAEDFTSMPGIDVIWFYGDSKRFQVFGHFAPGAGFRYQERDDAKRKQLDALVYPTNVTCDRTHLIPIGFHGSENSNKLLIGWDSAQNQGPMQEFEKRAKGFNRKKPIYWKTDVRRVPGGATWRYVIYDASDQKNPKEVMHLDLEYKHEIAWRIKDPAHK